MRFHLDEQVDPAIAAGLRQRGIDVTTTIDVSLLSATYEAHVAFAAEEQRVVFTHDRDFLRIDGAGVAHAGIAYCPPQSRSLGHIIRHLCLMNDCLESDAMLGKVEYL